VHQGYLEPQGCVAQVEPDGRLTLYSATQGHFYAQQETAAVLGIPESRLRVVPMPVGGGFGGKIFLLEPLVAAAALALGRPVQLVLTRYEDFLCTRPGPAAVIAVRLGASRDGRLLALKARLVFNVGADPEEAAAGIASLLLSSTYRIPHLDVTGLDVLTHTRPTGAYRAPGAPQAYFALESHLDRLARQLGKDPLELRLVLQSTVDTEVQLRLWLDDRQVSEQTIPVRKGTTALTAPLSTLSRGFHRFWARIESRTDTFRQNNELGAFTVVKEKPRLLLVAPNEADVRDLREALQAAEMQVEVRPPSVIPPRLSAMKGYTAVLLVNTPASSLTLDQMKTLQAYVRTLGGGLITIGEDLAYRLGREYGIRYAIENHPEKTPDELLRRIGDRADVLGVTSDTGFWGFHGFDPVEATYRLKDVLLHVHLKDVTLGEGRHESCAYGRGVVDIRGVVQALRAIGYQGAVSVEHEPHDRDPSLEVQESLQRLRTWLAAS